MKRPNLEPIFSEKSDFCEVSSQNELKTYVPGQAMRLSELMSRFEKGQRLNVKENFPAMSNCTEGKIYQENIEDCPPDDVHDIVDVHNYYAQHNEHKREFISRKKEKKSPEKAEGKDAPPQEGKDAPPAD